MFRHAIRNAAAGTARRSYATKSKTTNLTTTPRVPITETALSDGSIFVTRESPVAPKVQATAPPLRANANKPQLTAEQINEMRQLRQQDPATWTRKKLADKFGCSELFVSISAPTVKRAVKVELEASSKAGYRRQLIRKNRERRRELW
ncbi:mitochondrial ribosomal protein subunit L20-domain-containing protein [Zychaea mexicana]|uniref:mitochondrial ribosomal protein subunit L20-domain-containing protein n=1 Tax=Zychaea mexicana TaxID=64656 RepID=UPI0022FE6ADF|nr:mitochondrial ribosomal protein subunit L20-domain-containing protein [Zychaea mexicana]KAI9489543.1 mitochondrial ribosomal protein subunit L20-domain-containing protein [Zychaea mexicana]